MDKAKTFFKKHGWLVALAIIIPAGEILLLIPFIKNKFFNKNNPLNKENQNFENN